MPFSVITGHIWHQPVTAAVPLISNWDGIIWQQPLARYDLPIVDHFKKIINRAIIGTKRNSCRPRYLPSVNRRW